MEICSQCGSSDVEIYDDKDNPIRCDILGNPDKKGSHNGFIKCRKCEDCGTDEIIGTTLKRINRS